MGGWATHERGQFMGEFIGKHVNNIRVYCISARVHMCPKH